MRKWLWILALGFFFFILWVIYLADSGGSSVFFDWVRKTPNGDKIGHFFLFGVLTLLMIAASGFRVCRIKWLPLYYGAIGVFLFVLLEEISQIFFATRTFDLKDLTADVAGISFFSGLAALIHGQLKKGSSASQE
jgi:hypothetical protein